MHRLTNFILALTLSLLAMSTAVSADVLGDIQKRGDLRVGLSLFSPWTMKTPKNELIGFEVDLAKRLASDIGVKPQLKVYEWQNIEAALNKGEIDVIAAGMAITPERALRVNFSRPYMTSGLSLVTNTALTKEIKSLSELNQPSVHIATVTGTLADNLVGSLFDKVSRQSFDSKNEAEQAIINGKVQGYVTSTPEAQVFVLEHADRLDLPLDKPLVASKAGLAVKKGDQEWLNFLNSWVVANEASGWLGTSYNYWFRSLSWRSQMME